MASEIQNALSLQQSQPLQAPKAGTTMDATKKAAKEFEAVFISQFLGSMFEGIQTDGMFGGGQGEQIFRSMMLDQYGKQLANQGGFGLADAVTRSLIQHQEAEQRAKQEAADAAKGETKAKEPDGISLEKKLPVFTARKAEPAGIALMPRTQPLFPARATQAVAP